MELKPEIRATIEQVFAQLELERNRLTAEMRALDEQRLHLVRFLEVSPTSDARASAPDLKSEGELDESRAQEMPDDPGLFEQDRAADTAPEVTPNTDLFCRVLEDSPKPLSVTEVWLAAQKIGAKTIAADPIIATDKALRRLVRLKRISLVKRGRFGAANMNGTRANTASPM